ncbi:MAG: carbon monoxide dehydrogenase subunit G [Chloroflexi bacterium]|nr:carbon monoxide dehydrogenase subunit G [Chloroflexota bacterium]
MKIEGSYAINAPADKVWALLLDPKAIAKCIPGCQGLEPAGPGRYQATIRIGVATIQGTYRATIQVVDPRPANEYRLRFEGQGGSSFVKGEAHVTLAPGGNGTRVAVVGQAQLGGGLAAVGQRLAGGAAQLLMGQFFKRMKRLAEGKDGRPAGRGD